MSRKSIDNFIMSQPSEEFERKESAYLVRLPKYKKGEPNKIKIANDPPYIPFENSYRATGRVRLEGDYNGYIGRDGSFYPGITISSTRSALYYKSFITMGQYADALLRHIYEPNKDLLERLDDENQNDMGNTYDADCLAHQILTDELGFARFYRYINDGISERSTYPTLNKSKYDVTLKQLITLLNLFHINYRERGDTRVDMKEEEIGRLLVKKIGNIPEQYRQ